MTDLDKLEALAKAATQGEWETSEYGDVGVAGTDWGVSYPSRSGTIASLNDGEYITNPNSIADSAFIAAANPATILDLIASARRDAEEIARALDLLNEARNGGFFIGTEAGPKVEEAKDVLRAYLARAAHTGEG